VTSPHDDIILASKSVTQSDLVNDSNMPSADRPSAGPGVPEMVYESRLETTRQQRRGTQRLDRRLVTFRTVLFLAMILLGCICLGKETVSWLWLLIPVAALVTVSPFHNRVVRKLGRQERLTTFLENSLERTQHRWNHRPMDGSPYADDQHSWSQDLDLFGRGSLFQLLNECRTEPGRRRLADWMTAVPTAATIQLRQTRSAALRQRLDLRESLAVVADHDAWQDAESLLLGWASEPPRHVAAWVVGTSVVLGMAAIPIVTLVSLDMLPVSAVLLLAVLQAPLIAMMRTQIKETAAAMDAVDKAMQQLAAVIQVFERETFTHATVVELQHGFSASGGLASDHIARLSMMTSWLNHSLRNQFFSPIAWMCGLLILLTSRMESWRRRHGAFVRAWLNTCAEFEATISIAAWDFERPNGTTPELTTDARFTATSLGHPLLSDSQCVTNSVCLNPETPLMLISGSNMSGKSTLLRSVGCNLVLMYCGGVVTAERLTSCPFLIGTAMRVSDSLQDGRSLFMSVVDRLRMVVNLTEDSLPVMFLLDEILQGTNSHDRRQGAEAVIRMLVDQNAVGMVTTHDLALTRIVDTMDGRAVNMHFEDTIVDGRMSFDYSLKPGVVTRSNALHLMRLMGLKV
jgi:MutS domain V